MAFVSAGDVHQRGNHQKIAHHFERGLPARLRRPFRQNGVQKTEHVPGANQRAENGGAQMQQSIVGKEDGNYENECDDEKANAAEPAQPFRSVLSKLHSRHTHSAAPLKTRSSSWGVLIRAGTVPLKRDDKFAIRTKKWA